MRRPLPFGVRTIVLVALLAAGFWAWHLLDLGLDGLTPSQGGMEKAWQFVRGAWNPSWTSQDEHFAGTPLWRDALDAARLTVVFAAAGVGLAIAIGAVLGFFGSTAWWAGDARGGFFRRAIAPVVYGVTRVLITGLRSIHEVLWAIVFACIWPEDMAFAATIAIVIPYSGTFAKVFSEMIDEAPRDAAFALRSAGARPLQVFVFGLVPRAAPEIVAYSLYRFECGLRSAAVLGWFGIPTLGEKIMRSDENNYYGEVWLYLYTLIALILVVEWWSGAVRKRLVWSA